MSQNYLTSYNKLIQKMDQYNKTPLGLKIYTSTVALDGILSLTLTINVIFYLFF